MNIDRAARIAFEAGIKEVGRVFHGSALGEGQLDDRLIGFAGADDAGMFPNGDAAPFPRFLYLRVSLAADGPDAGERLAAPVAELLDLRIDAFGGSGVRLLGLLFSRRRFHYDLFLTFSRRAAGLPVSPML